MRRVIEVAAVAALGIALLFWNLGAYPFWEPDEARHALIARGVAWGAKVRDWIVPSLDGRPYHDKPILFYWLVALAYRVAGTTELAARSVSAIAALATAMVVQRWGSAAWGRGAGVAAAIVVLTTGDGRHQLWASRPPPAALTASPSPGSTIPSPPPAPAT
jgi:4-amino-4-deoxy-L-arabinose transferase-like glycosyltransferase